jgi:hypothetical protein
VEEGTKVVGIEEEVVGIKEETIGIKERAVRSRGELSLLKMRQ